MAPTQLSQTTLAILAGGEGARMGRAKGLLEIRGKPILEYLLECFDWPGSTLLVTAPGREHPPEWRRFTREISDPVAGLGPLRGVLTALEAANTELVVIATVDMPGVGMEQLIWLLERLEEEEKAGVMCKLGQRVEPFPCAFRTSAAKKIRGRLEAGESSVYGLSQCDLAASVAAPAAWGADVWINLNRPEDLERFNVKA